LHLKTIKELGEKGQTRVIQLNWAERIPKKFTQMDSWLSKKVFIEV